MRKIGTILISMGALLLLLVFGLNFYSEYKYNSLMEGYIESQGNNQSEAENKEDKEVMPSNTIGIIEIPKIDLRNPILDGVSNDVLRVAVGRFTESDPLGSTGTATIIGHNKYILNQPFKRLDELKADDIINIIVEDTTYTYVVRDTYTVAPTDRSVLKVEEGYPALVVITCTDDAEKRFVVKAEMINPEDAKSLLDNDLEENVEEDLE